MPTDHVTWVQRLPAVPYAPSPTRPPHVRYRARCACGWSGPAHTDHPGAQHALGRHRLDVLGSDRGRRGTGPSGRTRT